VKLILPLILCIFSALFLFSSCAKTTEIPSFSEIETLEPTTETPFEIISQDPVIVNLIDKELTNDQLAQMVEIGEIPRNVTVLLLDLNSINDISALSGLTELTKLSITFNYISNLDPLSKLTNLTHLQLYCNQINDVSALRTLAGLTNLELGENQISDISSLIELTNLTHLTLDGNDLSEEQINELQTALPECTIIHLQFTDE